MRVCLISGFLKNDCGGCWFAIVQEVGTRSVNMADIFVSAIAKWIKIMPSAVILHYITLLISLLICQQLIMSRVNEARSG